MSNKNKDLSGYTDSSYMDNTPDGNQGISPFRFGSRDQRLYTNLGLQAQIEAQPKILAFESDPTAPPPDNGFPVFAMDDGSYSFEDTKNQLSGPPRSKYSGQTVAEPLSVKVTDAGYGGAMMSTDPEMIEGIYVTSRQGREFLDTEGTPLQQIEDSDEQTEEEQFMALPRFGRGSAFNGFQTRMIGYGNGKDVNPELMGEYITGQAAEEIFDTDGTPLDSIGKNGETEEQQFEDLPQFGRGGVFGRFERVHQNYDEHEADPEDFKADEIFNIDNLSTIPRFNRPRTLNQQMTQFITQQSLSGIEVDDLDDDEYITTAEADQLYHPDGETIAQIAQESRQRKRGGVPYPPFGERGVFRNAPANDGLSGTSAEIIRRSTQEVPPFEEFFKNCIRVTGQNPDGTVKYTVTNMGLFMVHLLAWAIANAPKNLVNTRNLTYVVETPQGKINASTVIIPPQTLETIRIYNGKYAEVATKIKELVAQLNRNEVLNPEGFEAACTEMAQPILTLIEMYNSIIRALFAGASVRPVLADEYVIPSGFLAFNKSSLKGFGATTATISPFIKSNLDKAADKAKSLTTPKISSILPAKSKRIGFKDLKGKLQNTPNANVKPIEDKLYNDVRLALKDVQVTGAYRNFIYLYRDIVKVFLELPLINAEVYNGPDSLLAKLKDSYTRSGNTAAAAVLNGSTEFTVKLGTAQANGVTLPSLADVSSALVKQAQALKGQNQQAFQEAVLSALSDYVGQTSDHIMRIVENFKGTKEAVKGPNPLLLRATKDGILALLVAPFINPIKQIVKDISKSKEEGSKVVEVAGYRMNLTSYLASAVVTENLELINDVLMKIEEALDDDEDSVNEAVSQRRGKGSVKNAYRISLVLELAELTKLLVETLFVEADPSTQGVKTTPRGLEIESQIDGFINDVNGLIAASELSEDVEAADEVLFTEEYAAESTEQTETADPNASGEGQHEDEYTEDGLVIIETDDGVVLLWDKDGKNGAVDFVYNDKSEVVGRYVNESVIDLIPVMYEDDIYYVDQVTGNVYTDANEVASPEIRKEVAAALMDEDDSESEGDTTTDFEGEEGTESKDTAQKTETPKELSGSNTGLYIAGGLLAAGGLWYFMSRANKKK